MGCGPSNGAKTPDHARNMALTTGVDYSRIKMLLLGASESGKSTFSKQMRIINRNSFTLEEKKTILPNIHSSILDAYQAVIKNSKKFGPVRNESQANAILAHNKDSLITPAIGRAVQQLWLDKGMQVNDLMNILLLFK